VHGNSHSWPELSTIETVEIHMATGLIEYGEISALEGSNRVLT
jgi:hypothetical protein